MTDTEHPEIGAAVDRSPRFNRLGGDFLSTVEDQHGTVHRVDTPG